MISYPEGVHDGSPTAGGSFPSQKLISGFQDRGDVFGICVKKIKLDQL